jgi:hypothetical protein
MPSSKGQAVVASAPVLRVFDESCGVGKVETPKQLFADLALENEAASAPDRLCTSKGSQTCASEDTAGAGGHKACNPVRGIMKVEDRRSTWIGIIAFACGAVLVRTPIALLDHLRELKIVPRVPARD